MASPFSTANAHEDASGHRQPGETGARQAEVSASQGTHAVHGTWCREGEAGRHRRTKAGYGPETPRPAPVPLRLERIATQAQPYPDRVVTTLAHHLDVAMRDRACGRLNPHSAPGVDRGTWQTDKAKRATRLAALHAKLVNGTDGPPPVVRRLIPTSHGQRRPRGLPALEDTSVAQAGAMLVEAIYAQECGDGSYGFRPGRSPHHALHEGRQGWRKNGSGSGIDCDLSAGCDHVPHDTLCTMLRQRLKDGRGLELIERWRHAGILDGQEMGFPDKGRPQGSVRSPL
jgi:RNA-directed DNA polymerase